jgi:hypothetical protein
MTTFLTILPLALVPLLFALLIKLAAFVLRRTVLSWRHAFTLGFLAFVIGGLGMAINFASGRVLPPLLTSLIGIAIQVALGGWYLGPRARTRDDQPVGFVRGMLLSLTYLGIVLVLSVLLAVLAPAFEHTS